MALTPEQIKIEKQNRELALQILLDDFERPSTLRGHLARIIGKQHLFVQIPAVKDPVRFEYSEAWGIIQDWWKNSESNLSMPEQGSITFRAGKLFESLEDKQNNMRVADAVRTALQDRVADTDKELPLPEFNSFQKAMAAQNDFYKAYNDNLLNPLTNKLADSPLLAYLSPGLRKVVASQLAANWPNYLKAGQRNELTMARDIDEISHLIIHSSTKERNNLAHLLHSGEGEKQLMEILDTIDNEVSSQYRSGGKIDTKKAIADASKFAEFSLAGNTLSGVSYELGKTSIAGLSGTDKKALDRAIRSEIMKSTKGAHINGSDLVTGVLAGLGIDKDADPDRFNALFKELHPLAAQIESTEIAMRAKYLGSGFFEGSNTRLLATDFIAEKIGVDPFVPWLKPKDIDSARTTLFKKYYPGATPAELAKLNPLDLVNAEMAKGSAADPRKINEIFFFLDREQGHRDYTKARSDGTFSTAHEFFAKNFANLQSAHQTYDRFYRKAWDKIDKVDDIIRYPQRQVVELLDRLKERVVIPIGKYRVPVFGLPGFLVDRWIGVQKRISLGFYKFARGSSRINNPFWRGVGAYSKAFYRADANFAHTNFYFFEKGWGNMLNWATKVVSKGKYAGFADWKVVAGKKLWDGFAKMAPKMAEKFAGTAVAKIITSLGFATVSGGTTLLLQIGLYLIGAGIKAVWKFFTDKNYRDRALNLAPLIGAIAAIPLMFQSIGAGIVFAIGSLASFVGLAFSSVLGIFMLALAIAGGFMLSAALLFNVFKTTVNLDSGVGQLLVNIICEQSPDSGGDPTANVALCIAKFAKECPGINPVFKNTLSSSGWKCMVAGLIFPGAVGELEKSATSQNWLQCVGLSSAGATGAGKPFSTGQRNACSYAKINEPAGYRYISGCPGMKPGDHFVMGVEDCVATGGSTVGHIGVVIDPSGGQKFTCVDANYSEDGIIRGPESCFFAKSEISGCLRAI